MIRSNHTWFDTVDGADLEYIVFPFLKGYFTGAMGEIQKTPQKRTIFISWGVCGRGSEMNVVFIHSHPIPTPCIERENLCGSVPIDGA